MGTWAVDTTKLVLLSSRHRATTHTPMWWDNIVKFEKLLDKDDVTCSKISKLAKDPNTKVWYCAVTTTNGKRGRGRCGTHYFRIVPDYVKGKAKLFNSLADIRKAKLI